VQVDVHLLAGRELERDAVGIQERLAADAGAIDEAAAELERIATHVAGIVRVLDRSDRYDRVMRAERNERP